MNISVGKELVIFFWTNDIYNLIANRFEKIKKYDSAYYYLRKHKNLSDTVLSDKNFAHLTFIQTQHETEIKEKENQRLRTIQFDQLLSWKLFWNMHIQGEMNFW